eukprot:scaffold234029_cov20-Tisochrysis_lutea.AAC.4
MQAQATSVGTLREASPPIEHRQHQLRAQHIVYTSTNAGGAKGLHRQADVSLQLWSSTRFTWVVEAGHIVHLAVNDDPAVFGRVVLLYLLQ